MSTNKYAVNCTTRLFQRRIRRRYPHLSGLYRTSDPTEIRLLLKDATSRFHVQPNEPTPQDAIWWFWGDRSVPIEDITVISHTRMGLICNGSTYEIEPKEMVAFVDEDRLTHDFIYIACTPTEHPMQPDNYFIAPKESKLNNVSGAAGLTLEEACAKLKQGRVRIEQFPVLLERLPESAYHRYLLGEDD